MCIITYHSVVVRLIALTHVGIGLQGDVSLMQRLPIMNRVEDCAEKIAKMIRGFFMVFS